MVITTFYTGLLAILFLAISLRVMRYRNGNAIAIGDGGSNQMQRYIRGHANFAEYVPFILLMMALAEYNGTVGWLLHACGAMLLVGRVLHGYAFMIVKFNMPARITGVVLTLIPLLVLAVLLTVKSAGQLFS